MFSRVEYDPIATPITIIAFFITAGAFAYLIWRGLKMGKKKREHMKNLPLEDEDAKKRSDS